MELSKAEKQLMEIIWKKEKVFMKDILEAYPEPKPATTTIATLLKRIQDKEFVAYRLFGNSRQYYPLVKKKDYFSKHVKGIIKNYFEDSPLDFASFFTTSTNLSASELEKLREIIDQQIQKKKK
jgi:BlaI family transcriptional regulator, penicillinase repressor